MKIRHKIAILAGLQRISLDSEIIQAIFSKRLFNIEFCFRLLSEGGFLGRIFIRSKIKSYFKINHIIDMVSRLIPAQKFTSPKFVRTYEIRRLK